MSHLKAQLEQQTQQEKRPLKEESGQIHYTSIARESNVIRTTSSDRQNLGKPVPISPTPANSEAYYSATSSPPTIRVSHTVGEPVYIGNITKPEAGKSGVGVSLQRGTSPTHLDKSANTTRQTQDASLYDRTTTISTKPSTNVVQYRSHTR